MFSMQHNDSAVDLRDDDSAWTSMVNGSGSGTEDERDDDEVITIHDSIHGHVPIHPLLKAIIDTPEFDRCFVGLDKVLFVETSFGWFLGFVASDSSGLHTTSIPGGNIQDGSIPSARPTLHQSFWMPLRRRSQVHTQRKITFV